MKREQATVASATESNAAILLQSAARAEQQLLRAEQKAERKLSTAQRLAARNEAKLRKARQRLEESELAVSTAAQALRECQTRRAIGPTVNGN